jgi:2,4-dienoyl-CoA reductase-like NADH-dependent reductase (Old Yellow Enzyme family)
MNDAAMLTRKPPANQARVADELFQPYRLGPFNLTHRIVMAPLTPRGHASQATCRGYLPPATTRSARPQP